MDSFVGVVLKVLYFAIVFGIIIIFANCVTRLLGKKVFHSTTRYMNIVDVMYIGNDKALMIAMVGQDYILVSSTAKGIEVVKELDGFDKLINNNTQHFEEGNGGWCGRRKGLTCLFKRFGKGPGGRDDQHEG
jgi:flagellar biogenesis protein FliO